MRKVLFLDIDGVLHRGIARRSGSKVISSAPGMVRLFEYSSTLEWLLSPYPDIEIVLSSDWPLVVGYEFTLSAFTSSDLRNRIKGKTSDGSTIDDLFWPTFSRGAQVLDYVSRNAPIRWLAVDDRSDGFEAHRHRLVHCQTDAGLGDNAVVDHFRRRLLEYFSDAIGSDSVE